MQDQPTTPTPRPAALAFAQTLAGVAVGLVVAYLILTQLVVPKLGFGRELSRVAAIADRTAQPFAPSTLVIVSNSVGVEGISADAMKAAAPPGWDIINLSMNGTEVLSIQVLLSQILSAKPDAVLWVIRPEAIGEPRSINPQMAKAFKLAGYTDHVPWFTQSGPTKDAPKWLSAESLESLQATPADIKLSMRVSPLAAINETVRNTFRSGWRPADPANFNDPHFLTADITGKRLRRHIEETVSSITERAGDPQNPPLDPASAGETRAGASLIADIARTVKNTGATMVFAVAPSHPDFRETMLPYEAEILTRLRALPGAPVVIDATAAIADTDFADAIHPNAAGRQTFSAFIGARLPAPSTSE